VQSLHPLPSGRIDWGPLLRAARARLRSLVDDAPDACRVADDSARRVRAEVLGCMDTLDAVRDAVQRELERYHVIERELVGATAAVAQSRAELAATRHGERRARHLAFHDSLTTLPNRLFFDERLTQALIPTDSEHAGLTVLYIDLDGLKSINDLHGHATGDEVIRIVAARLRGALRTQDVVCRLGGDEFACLLNEPLARTQLEPLACKLFDTVSAPMQVGARALVVLASIGIASCPDDGTTGAELVKQADRAMYRAKRDRTGYAFGSLEAGRRPIQLGLRSNPSRATSATPAAAAISTDLTGSARM
jgi:diguanylate cyclase (GGDEF)-like protein